MDNKEILKHVDHTQLKPDSTFEHIKILCEETLRNNCACACMMPSYVKAAREAYPTVNISACIGFPLGYNTTAVKVFETIEAIKEGATEIDVVINQGWVKENRYDLVTEEIKKIKAVCGDVPLKVIIETCYLNDEQKIELCKCVTDAKADYIKTSTGFGSAGATVEDVKLFKKYVGENVKIKAAGGIRTKEDMEAMIEAGAERIGCSAAVKLLGE